MRIWIRHSDNLSIRANNQITNTQSNGGVSGTGKVWLLEGEILVLREGSYHSLIICRRLPIVSSSDFRTLKSLETLA